MRIAFNGQRFAGQRFGVGRYLEYLLRHWSQMIAAGDEVTVFLRRPLSGGWSDFGPRIEFKLLESKLAGLPWENLVLRGAAVHHDVLFCPAYTAPIGYRRPLVVATHSVNETVPGAHDWRYRQTYARLHRHCARNADAVIVPGAMTRDAVVDAYGVTPAKVHVVHQGADDAFQPIADADLLAATRRRFFGRDRPYILFVGGGSPRRNIPMLIEAVARLRSGGFPHGLLLFGPWKGDEPLAAVCARFGMTDDVVQTDGVVAEHRDLVPVYAAADVFVHPSENEGWSMTTTEALACGVPVIASNRGGLGEVAAGAAYMIDQPSVETLAAALRTVLDDPALQADLRRRARERGLSLRWDNLARQTLDIVRAVGTGTDIFPADTSDTLVRAVGAAPRR